MTIKELRTSMNLTQVQVSKITNIPLRTYKLYENDESKVGTIKYNYIINKLERLTDNNTSWLLQDKLTWNVLNNLQ